MKTSIFEKASFLGFFLFALGILMIGFDYVAHNEITNFPYVASGGLIVFVIGLIGSKEKFLQMPSKTVQGTIYFITAIFSLLISKGAGFGILPTLLCTAIVWLVVFLALTIGRRFLK